VTCFRPFTFLPFRAPWIALITEFEWNHHFADVQKKGPFKRFQHRHEFSEEPRNGASGTTVHDVIEYDPGFGALRDLAQRCLSHPASSKHSSTGRRCWKNCCAKRRSSCSGTRYLIASTTTAVPYASTSVTPCMISVAS
jgi:hypothetical protein